MRAWFHRSPANTPSRQTRYYFKEAGVSDKVIAAIVSKKNISAGQAKDGPTTKPDTPAQSAAVMPRHVGPAQPRKLTVLAVSHSTSENVYTVTTPQTTNTNCNLYPNSLNCSSTTSGGGSQNKAVYRFLQAVTSTDGGRVTRYTLSRTARWIWNSMTWPNDGETFAAEIKGKHMFITCRRGGNQGKKEILKYDILDIR